MPKIAGNVPLNTADMEVHKLPTGTFGFSATRLADLGATEYTLATIVVDCSGSVEPFKSDLEHALKEIVQACKLSPRADNLMLRIVGFATGLFEIHGYKLLSTCNLDDYKNCLVLGGMTALYDASENAVEAATAYAQNLSANDFSVNAIVVMLTDGADNASKGHATDVHKALVKATKTEAVESLVSILIGVGTKADPRLSPMLQDFQIGAGITQYVEIADANAKTLAKLAAFISKSISMQSQALGTGGPSKLTSLSI